MTSVLLNQTIFLQYIFAPIGGWIRIGRLVTDAKNINLYNGANTIKSSDYSTLYKASTKNFLLSGDTFSHLKSLINFSEYRVYCTKPYHGRTNHAKFSNTNPKSVPLFKYATEKPSALPGNLCNALFYMDDDTSRTSVLDCSSLRPKQKDLSQRLYDEIWFSTGQVYLTIDNKSRLECDDHQNEPGFNPYGTWMFYVR